MTPHPLVDSHCHLNYEPLAADFDGVVERMRQAGVGGALLIATELEAHGNLVALCDSQEGLCCSVGIHPNHCEGDPPPPDRIARLAESSPHAVAIGETGLDHYRDGVVHGLQRRFFSAHIRASLDTGKPLVVHTRNSISATLDQLEEEGKGEARGVLHCFNGTVDQAMRTLDLGLMLSFTGIVTFKNATEVAKIVPKVPGDRYMVETDAPYLAPVPHRGKTNEPAFVRHVAEKCAELRGESPGEVAHQTTGNFNRLFGTAIGRPPSPPPGSAPA